MSLDISEEPVLSAPADYALVPIAFEVRSAFDVIEWPDGVRLVERPVAQPYLKDFEEGPVQWQSQFDLSKWSRVSARMDGRLIGGATVAFDTPDVDMLEGRSDLAVLWDIRIAPELRGRGIGRHLFRAVEAWAIGRDCAELVVETQNINVPACRFYERQGCRIRRIRRGAYSQYPDEIQILWSKEL